MTIKYKGRLFANNQKSEITRWYIDALTKNYNVYVDNSDKDGNIYHDSVSHFYKDKLSFLGRLVTNPLYYDTVIHDVNPDEIVIERGKLNIGIVLVKTTTLPEKWIDNCNRLDMIITPTTYCYDSIKASGVYTPIYICPPPIDTMFKKVEPLNLGDIPDKRFLMDISNISSENWINAINTFFHMFKKDDGVILMVASPDKIVHDAIKNMSQIYTNPPLTCSLNTINNEIIYPSLYSSATAYYSLSAGNAIGINYLKALACGIPCICADRGGHMEYLDRKNSIIIPSIPSPAIPCDYEPYYNASLMWCKPYDLEDIDKLKMMNIDQLEAELPKEYTIDHVTQKISTLLDEFSNKRSKPNTVDVSIIVLSYNKLGILREAINSIAAAKTTITYGKPITYELIVVENGSDRKNIELFEYLETLECRVIYQDPNVGFGPGNNIGAKAANGKILCFLNNDTEVTDGWLEPVIKNFEDKNVGIVGVKLLFPNMTIQHAGIALKQQTGFYATHPHIEILPETPIVSIRKEMLAVTGACLFIRKDIFNQLNGFDPIYKIGYYEDADLCLRVREAGYKVIYEPDTVVIHKTGQTFKTYGELKQLNFFVDNEKEFRSRWDRKITNNLYMFTSRHNYEPDKKNIAILNSYMETYGGGEKLSGYIAKALEDDSNVDLLIRIPNKVTKKTIREYTGIELKKTEVLSIMSGEPIKYIRDYDVFINSEWCSREIGNGRYNILMTMFPDNTVDLKFLDSYDKIITISEFSRSWINRYYNRDAEVIYPPVDQICNDDEWPELKKNKYILSVGRFFVGGHNKKHDVMIDAFKKLVDNHKGFEEWELHLAGGLKPHKPDMEYMEMLKNMAEGYNVVFHVNAGQDELHNLYRLSKVYWHATGYAEDNPLTYEHFGIAPVEAVYANCVPILINKGGLPEIIKESGGFLWNSIDELVEITADQNSYMDMKLKYPYKFTSDTFIRKIRESL